MNFDTDFNQQDIGFQFGAGFDLKNYQISFTKRYGGIDIYKQDTNPDIVNEGFYLSLAYIF